MTNNDKVCHWPTGGVHGVLPVSPTNKTDCHDIIEILLKVALNIKTLTLSLIVIVKLFMLYLI